MTRRTSKILDSQINNLWEENQCLANNVDELTQEVENHEKKNEALLMEFNELQNSKDDLQYEMDFTI